MKYYGCTAKILYLSVCSLRDCTLIKTASLMKSNMRSITMPGYTIASTTKRMSFSHRIPLASALSTWKPRYSGRYHMTPTSTTAIGIRTTWDFQTQLWRPVAYLTPPQLSWHFALLLENWWKLYRIILTPQLRERLPCEGFIILLPHRDYA